MMNPTELKPSQIKPNQIKPNTPVVCSKQGQFGVVDHMQGTDAIKLNKDDKGVHHFIPMSWVTSVDDKVHINLTSDEAMKRWTTALPGKSS